MSDENGSSGDLLAGAASQGGNKAGPGGGESIHSRVMSRDAEFEQKLLNHDLNRRLN